MANEKWYRIEWNDELWTGLMSVSPGQVEANIGRRNAEDMVIDDIHMQEAMDISSELFANQGLAGSQSRLDRPVDVGHASDSVFQEVKKVGPRFDSDFVQEAPSYMAFHEEGLDSRRVEFDSKAFSYVQRPVNFTHIRSSDIDSNRILKNRSYELGVDGFFSENLPVTGQESDFLQNESGRIALQQTVRQVVEDKLSELKVYVLESDITDAQQAVKTVVKQATF